MRKWTSVQMARWPGWQLTVFTALLFFSILTISAEQRWAVGLFQVGLFALACGAVPWFQWHPLMIPLGAASLWPWAQLLWSATVYRFATLEAALLWTANLVVFLVGLHIFRQDGPRRAFLRALAYFGSAIAVVAVLQLFTSQGKIFWVIPTKYRDLVLGPFVYHNNYAAFIELVLPLVMCEAVRQSRRTLAFAAIAAVMFASVIAAGSRSGSIVVGVEMVAMLVLLYACRMLPARTFLITAGKLALLAAGFTALVGWGYIWKRFQEPNPYWMRGQLLRSSLSMVRDRPWSGSGLGTWPEVYPAYASFDNGKFINHAHNDWAEWAAEGGIPFFLCLLAVAGFAARHALRFPWALGICCVFLHSLVNYPMQKPALAALVFALIAALCGGNDSRALYSSR